MHGLSAHLIPLHWSQFDEEQLARIQPRSIKLVDSFGRANRIYQLSPRSLFVFRHHPISEEHDDMWRDPEGTGKRHANEWPGRLAQNNIIVPPEQFIVLGINEPHVWRTADGSNWGDPYGEGVKRTVAYTVAFLRRLRELGIRGGALNLSVGWPANSGTDMPPVWEPYEPVRDEILAGDHFLVVHEYWPKQGPHKRWGWLGGRVLSCPWDVPIIIGETGMEQRVVQDLPDPNTWGWRYYLTPQQYYDQLSEYNRRMMTDRRIHSLQIFSWDYSHPFDSVDIRREPSVLPLIPRNDAWDNMVDWQPTKPPPTDDFAARLLAEAERQQVIQFNPQAALQKRIFADGLVPNSAEFPFENNIAQRAERLSDGTVRAYYVPVGEWDKVDFVQR